VNFCSKSRVATSDSQQEATQNISVLDVPFQQVTIDDTTEKKIAGKENWQRYAANKAATQREMKFKHIARTNAVMT